MASKVPWYSEERRGFLARTEQFLTALSSPLGVVLIMFTLLGGYFAVVEWRVRSIIYDPDFRAEIVRRVRPSLVFDSEGHVFTNTGARELLESVPEVRPASKDDHTLIVTIRPKVWLAAEPILESLDMGAVSVTTRRSKDMTWKVTLSTPRYLVVESQPKWAPPPRFRLELFPP